MSDANQDILERHNELRDVRSREEKEWLDILRLFSPDMIDLDARGQNPVDYSEIFDSTHLNALDNFEGGIFGQLVNPANRWAELGVEGDPELSVWGPVKKHLWERMNVIYSSLSPASSAFYAEAPTWIGHVGMVGFGTFYQEERPGGRRMVDRAIPIGECFFDTDLDGELTVFNRAYPVRGRQFKEWFGEADKTGTPLADRQSVVVIHAVRPNPDFLPGVLGNRGKPWQSIYVSPDRAGFRREGGYYEFCYHVPMWRRRAGRPYPTGPGHRVRPDVSTLQEMERSHLVAAQFAAEPPTLLHEDSGLTAADIVPNAVLEGTMNQQGKPLAHSLQRTQNLNLSHVQSEQRREAIRQAFFFGIMQLVNRPQMTATEFLGFQEENLRLMGPSLVRIQTGGLSPFIARRNNMLERAGRLPPPPRELEGRRLSIEYVSPLAKAMKLGTARSVLQYHQAIESMAVTDPNVRDNFDADQAAILVHDAMVGDPNVLRSRQAVDEIRQARQNREAEIAQFEDASQAVSIAAEAAHAEQAGSLADNRRRAA